MIDKTNLYIDSSIGNILSEQYKVKKSENLDNTKSQDTKDSHGSATEALYKRLEELKKQFENIQYMISKYESLSSKNPYTQNILTGLFIELNYISSQMLEVLSEMSKAFD